jgi:hypothetical protein
MVTPKTSNVTPYHMLICRLQVYKLLLSCCKTRFGYNELVYNELDYNELDYNELDYNELNYYELNYNKLDYNKLGYNEQIKISIWLVQVI